MDEEQVIGRPSPHLGSDVRPAARREFVRVDPQSQARLRRGAQSLARLAGV